MSGSGFSWRLHGQVPPYDQFIANVFATSVLNMVIERAEEDTLVGFCQMWKHDPHSNTAQLTAFLSDDSVGLGWPLEGVVNFVRYAFQSLGLRKIYFESLTPEMEQYESLVGTVLVQEGRLRDHSMVMGELHDLHVFALYKQDLERRLEKLNW